MKCIKFQEELDSCRFPGPWSLDTLILPTLRDGISSLKVTSPYMLHAYMSSAGVYCLVSVSSINTCGDGPVCKAGTNASVATKQSGLIIEVYHQGQNCKRCSDVLFILDVQVNTTSKR